MPIPINRVAALKRFFEPPALRASELKDLSPEEREVLAQLAAKELGAELEQR